jgi:hypothetical protein
MFYSLQDNQCEGRIMAICRNSNSIEFKTALELLQSMSDEKLEYHSDLELEKGEKLSDMYDLKSIKGNVDCLTDFQFSILKHEKPFLEDDDGDVTFNQEYIEHTPMSFDEAVKEFSQ